MDSMLDKNAPKDSQSFKMYLTAYLKFRTHFSNVSQRISEIKELSDF